jgi:cytochrome P450
MCVGQHLAKLEMNAIFCALATRVKRFHVQQEARDLNNVLRGSFPSNGRTPQALVQKGTQVP